MKQNVVWLCLMVILIIAAFLRLYQLPEFPPGLYPDEAMNGNNALEVLQTAPPAGGFRVYYPENNGREGLFINIQALFLNMVGKNEPWVLRLPSAIFGILTVLGMYLFTKELFSARIPFSPKPRSQFGSESPISVGDQTDEDKRASRWSERSGLRENEILALLSAFFLATSFWHIMFSRIGFRAIMAPLLLTWSLYLLLKALNQVSSKFQAPNYKHQISSNEQNKKGFGVWFLPALAGLVYGLGFYTYIAYRITPLLVLFIIWWHWKRAQDTVRRNKIILFTFSFLFFTFLTALPLGLYYLQNPADFLGRTGQLSIFASDTPLYDLARNTVKTLGMFNVTGDWNWRHNFAGRPQLFWPIGILFLIGVTIGIKQIFKNPKHQLGFSILFLWFLLAMLPVVISNEGLPHALRAILMIPPVIILSAVGGVWLYEKIATKMRKIFLLPTLYFLLSLFVLEAYQTYFIRWGGNPNVSGAFSANYVELGRTLNALPRETQKYVLVEAGGVLVRGIPMPTQTVMFITDTYLPEQQREKNIYYLLPAHKINPPSESLIFYLK